MDVRWKHPWTSILCGPIGCGKTIFVKTFLRHLSLMSDVRFERILFYYAEWQEAYRRLQYDTRVKEQPWGCNNIKTAKKKNIIEFREELLRNPEDYSNDPLSPKLVIIDDLMRESSSCDAIVDLSGPKAVITRISVLFLSRRTYSTRGMDSAIYRLRQITSSFSKIYVIVLKFVIYRVKSIPTIQNF